MGLHKPQKIPKLSEINADKDISRLLQSIGTYGSKKTDQNILRQLAQTEPFYPVIQVPGKALLLAVNKKDYHALHWLSDWFEVDSAYYDSRSIYKVRLKINGHSVEVDYDALYPKDITKLSRFGLIINFDYAESLSRYVFKRIAGLEVKEQINDMGFILRDGALTFRAYSEDPELLKYTEDIDMANYITGINCLLTNTALMFALCCACASLFLAFLSIACGQPLMSFVISFYGKTTTGKSTAQALMASVFSDPKDKSIYRPFFGTLNALLKIISRRFGIPQLFDEATVTTGLNVSDLLYMITGETDKSRCTSDTNLREVAPWKLIVITSSENRLVPESRMHNRGLDARILSFELKFTDDHEHSDRIHAFCRKHYGILGKALSEHLLCADREEILQQYETCKDTMRDAIDDVATFDLAERLVDEYALILLAAETLITFGVHIDRKSIIAIMTSHCSALRERTDIAAKYYQHLLTYLVSHPYAEGIKKDESSNTVAFADELFIRILEDYGATNPELVIKELDGAGRLYRRKQNSLKNRLRFNGILINCYEIVLPEEESGSEDGCTTLGYILTHYEGVDES